MQTTQYYRVRNKSTKEERGMAVQAYEVGNMKRRWDILGPSDEEGNLIEGAVAVAKPLPQNEGSEPGAGPVGDKAPLTGSEETRNEANKRWKNAQTKEEKAEAVQATGAADENPPILNIMMLEPDIAPQPELSEIGAKQFIEDVSAGIKEMQDAVSEPANTPLPREARTEVLMTDQAPPHDEAKAEQARQATITPADAAAPAAEAKPAQTTRRRTPPKTTK